MTFTTIKICLHARMGKKRERRGHAVQTATAGGSRVMSRPSTKILWWFCVRLSHCKVWRGYVIERNGRHEETRTPDLYRVKVAL